MAFSPHTAGNARLQGDCRRYRNADGVVACSIRWRSSTRRRGRSATPSQKVTADPTRFVYGISDRKVGGGLDVQKPDGNVKPVYPAPARKNLPAAVQVRADRRFGDFGTRMHHKFVVIDFDNPATARVYLGSYNFSPPADTDNGENLLSSAISESPSRISSRRLRIFDHYHFRVTQNEKGRKQLVLARPPRKKGQKPWWSEITLTRARSATVSSSP